MFSDMTSGTETYAAGRYIDLDRTASGIYELDFNRPIIPYCYYNAATSARTRRRKTGSRCRSTPERS